MEMKASILLVENDYNFAVTLKGQLEQHGYTVVHSIDGETGWRAFQKSHYDLCILEVDLPVRNGFQLAKLIRNRNDKIPILFQTARGSDEDILAGFKAGADSYLVKPFSFEELLLRVDVFLRRTQTIGSADEEYRIGLYSFLYKARILTYRNGEQKELTKKTAELLRFLCKNANKCIKRDELLYHVWGKDDYYLGRSMDVFIVDLRKLLAADPGINLETLHGIGFKLRAKVKQLY